MTPSQRREDETMEAYVIRLIRGEERERCAMIAKSKASEPTARQIDAGAEALRQHEQGGRILRPWADLPNCDKKKWRIKAQTVLRSAFDQTETK